MRVSINSIWNTKDFINADYSDGTENRNGFEVWCFDVNDPANWNRFHDYNNNGGLYNLGSARQSLLNDYNNDDDFFSCEIEVKYSILDSATDVNFGNLNIGVSELNNDTMMGQTVSMNFDIDSSVGAVADKFGITVRINTSTNSYFLGHITRNLSTLPKQFINKYKFIVTDQSMTCWVQWYDQTEFSSVGFKVFSTERKEGWAPLYFFLHLEERGSANHRMGIINYSRAQNFSPNTEAGGSWQDDDTEATRIVKWKDISGATTLGCKGNCSVVVIDKNHDHLDKVQSWIGQDLFVTNNDANYVAFRGVILEPISVVKDGWKIGAKEKGALMKEYMAETNPILYSETIKRIEGGNIYNKFVDHSGWDVVGNPIITQKIDPKTLRYHPFDFSFGSTGDGGSYIPKDATTDPDQATEVGDENNLYFYDENWDRSTLAGVSSNLLGAYDRGQGGGGRFTQDFSLILNFTVYLHEEVTNNNPAELLEKLRIYTNVLFARFVNPLEPMKIRIYDYNSGAYETIKIYDPFTIGRDGINNIEYVLGGKSLSTEATIPKILDISLQRDQGYTLENYLLPVRLPPNEKNAYDFWEYEMKILLYTGGVGADFFIPISIYAHETFVELTPLSNTTQTLGETTVQSVTAEVINLTDNDLEIDGTCAGDIFNITLLINGIISTMWNNSGFYVKLDLDQSAFDDDGKGDFTDLSDTDILSVLEKYHVSYGLQFWQDDKTLFISDKASFTSCGITLIEDDYYYFLDNNINYSFDGSQLRGKMIVEGNLIKTETDLNPVPISNLTKYYFRPELTSTALINGFIDNVRSKHENLFYRVSGINLDLNRSDKSYLALKLGKTIALTLGAPDGAGGWNNTKIADHTSEGDGELYIKEIHFTSDGINDILSPILESELLGDEF